MFIYAAETRLGTCCCKDILQFLPFVSLDRDKVEQSGQSMVWSLHFYRRTCTLYILTQNAIQCLIQGTIYTTKTMQYSKKQYNTYGTCTTLVYNSITPKSSIICKTLTLFSLFFLCHRESSSRDDQVQNCVEDFLQVLTSILSEKRWLMSSFCHNFIYCTLLASKLVLGIKIPKSQ